MSSITDEIPENSLSNSARRAVQTSASSAHSAVDRAAGAAKPAIDRAANAAHGAIDSTAGVAQRGVDRFGDTADRLRELPAQYADTFAEGVRQNPWAAIGIALLTGFVLGRLTD